MMTQKADAGSRAVDAIRKTQDTKIAIEPLAEPGNDADMRACYEAIKKARTIRQKPVQYRADGVTYTHIPMEMWEVLQPVIEQFTD